MSHDIPRRSMPSVPFVIAAGLACALLAGPSLRSQQAAQTLAIAAASDLQTALPDIAARFEKSRGVKTTVSLGSSGNFFAQIQNGAPFDLFMSADVDYPRQLIAARLADADSLYEYATGRIVLWTRKASGIDVKPGLDVLRSDRVRRIAIANPQHAPYGRAAVAAMQNGKIYDTVRAKLVLGENISQTAQLVDSGNADVGIIALSLALGSTLRASGAYAEIPETTHPAIQQAAVIVSASRSKQGARDFLAFLTSPDISQLLRRLGFTPPSGR